MDPLGRFGVWSMTETKNPAGLFVDPILVIRDTVFVLNGNVVRVRLGNVLGRNASRDFVNVHVGRHTISLSQERGAGKFIDLKRDGRRRS